MNETAVKRAMEHYISKGLADFKAATIVGGFLVESNLNPRALGDRNLAVHAHGIGQWRGKRWETLQSFASKNDASPFSIYTQLDYALEELKTAEKVAGNHLDAAKTLEQAVDAMVDYERPAGWRPGHPREAKTWELRLHSAQKVLALWRTGNGGSGSA